MTTATLVRHRGLRFGRWIIIGSLVIVIGIAVAYFITNSSRTPVTTIATVAVTRGTVTQTVSGSGTINANQTVDLAFQTSGVVKTVLVKAGDTVQAGQPLATLDDRNLRSALTSAQANLDSANAKLEQARNGNATAAQLASAQAALTSAQVAYAATVNDTAAGDSTLRSLKASLDQAQITLQQAQAAYDRVAWRSDVGMSSEAKTLQSATIAYQKALGDYNAQLTTSGPDAQSKIASAQASLESAKANLASLTAPVSDTDLTIAQANVTSAQQALKQAQINLENVTLTAPFAGVVTTLDITPGSNASGTAVTLINTDPLHVELKLSETNVVQAAAGQKVSLTSDALSAWKADGTVSYVAPAGTTSNGVVSYLVRVDFKNTDARIKVGMTLNVDITTVQKDNVLLVPTSAISTEGDSNVAQVVGPDGKTQNVKVQTGISDGTHTEVTSGLTEDQKIAVLPTSTTSSSSSNNSRSGPGGGFFGLPF